MDKSQNLPHIPMDTSSTIPTLMSGQTSAIVSLDTDTLIAACQGAAWKISGWPENIAIHHAKGCACCHKYINHLLGAQSLGQINLQCLDIENTVQSAWPAFINSILTLTLTLTSGTTSSIELPSPGETSVRFLWRPVPEHLANLLGIREPLTAGDPPLS